MEEQIKMMRLNAEFSKKQNNLKARKQQVEAGKHAALQQVDEEYHTKKRELLADIADIRKQKEGLALDDPHRYDLSDDIRKQKEGLALDDPHRYDLSDDIRNIEDMLNIIRDERDIKARNVAHDAFVEHMELEEAGRRLDEWLEEEKIKVMEEQHAARLAKEAAEAEEGGEQ